MADIPFPTISSYTEEPPKNTDPVELGIISGRLNLWADDRHSSKADWVTDIPNSNSGSGSTLANYWGGTKPLEYKLHLRGFWRRVGYWTIDSGGNLVISYSKTWGLSTTDSQNISGEMGIDVKGISAKVSTELGHSVTTSQEETITKTMNFDNPKTDNVNVLYAVYQKIYEIVALDANMQPIPKYPNSANESSGDVWFFGGGAKGAYLRYPSVQQELPSEDGFHEMVVSFAKS